MPDEDHEHDWGPVERSRFAGTLHRKCQVAGCKHVTLDLTDEEGEEAEEEPALSGER